MENINPSLKLAIHLKAGIQAGQSVLLTLKAYLKQEDNELSEVLVSLLTARELGQSFQLSGSRLSSPHRQALFRLIERGLRGESILDSLNHLETEIKQSSLLEIDELIAIIPLKALIPLLLLQFPALLLLFLGPILESFSTAL